MAASLDRNDGRLVYALDDAYIHMAVAKHLATVGVWGQTPFGFTSSTSSPLWVLILSAGNSVLGVKDWLPLALNVAIAATIQVLAFLWLRRHVQAMAAAALLLALVLCVPLPTLTLIGMEHQLHLLLTGVVVVLVSGILAAAGARVPTAAGACLLVSGALLTATRYEGLFTVFVACLLLGLRRHVIFALALGICALASPVVYGIWSVLHGWSPVPTPVLLRGMAPAMSPGGLLRSLLWYPWGRLAVVPALGALAAVAIIGGVIAWREGRRWSAPHWAAAMFVPIAVLHLQFGAVGYFFRYEAYLVGIGILALAGAGFIPSRVRAGGRLGIATAALLLAASVPLFQRSASALTRTATATTNIYQQQYQMGQFLRRFYTGAPVALNDIGAATYLADVKLLDLWGLASRETARLRYRRTLSIDEMAGVTDAAGTELVMIFDSLFPGVPETWWLAGRWTIPDNVVCASSTVSIYATSAAVRDTLSARLRLFSRSLPPAVIQSGPYMDIVLSAADERLVR